MNAQAPSTTESFTTESVTLERDGEMSATFETAMSGLGRLNIIGELMEALDLVTCAGQGHVMQKVLKILRSELRQPGLPLSDAQFVVVTGGLTKVAHEAGRLAPSPSVFTEHAQVVVEVLRRAWSNRIATSALIQGGR